LAATVSISAQTTLRERLKALPFKIAYECYTNDNWDIFVVNADGSNPINLTATPTEHEHYPQICSDGKRICFLSDTGEGRSTVRSLCVMDIDGRNRRKLVERAQQPFWTTNRQVIGYLPQLYPKFNASDGYTDGMRFYDLQTGQITPHPVSSRIHQIYNPSFDPGGKWIAATVHAGMDMGHAQILIEAHGSKIIQLPIPGCRPALSPDGREISWGAGDHEIVVALLNLASDNPQVGPWRLRLKAGPDKIYHVDWSPDGRFLAFSRGPEGRGDPAKVGTYQAACEMIGIYAPGWNIYVVSADHIGTLDLNKAGDTEVAQVTTNGCSNKEPAWFRAQSP
jgi:Tol biopolymer transport system component